MRMWQISLFVVLALVAGRSDGGQNVGSIEISSGPTPFISFTRVNVGDSSTLRYVEFQIQPKAGSETRPIDVRYARSYLKRRGYLIDGNSRVTIPVFGLYAGRANMVTLTVGFVDGSSKIRTLTITTPSYDGGTYSNPEIVQARLPGTSLSYDFIMLKSYADPTTPIVIDTDGEIRWVGTAGVSSQPSAYFDNAFYLTSGISLLRTELDGTTTTLASYGNLSVVGFHHNIDPGKRGVILDANTVDDTECVNLEVDAAGNVLKTWNLAGIIRAAMVAGGDDPNQFVYPSPTDWFHNNCVAYRSSDDSLIVSSRENFVMAIDYDSGAIKWILGDPTKKWHQFRSLRRYALVLGEDTLPPIGQHAVSMPGDQLLLFDDGTNSDFQNPPGTERTYSAPRKYDIDLDAFTATEVYHYLANPSIYSPYCSSVYEDAPNNYVIDYTLGGPYIFTGIVGLDDTGSVAFDYRYDELDFCGTAWNAIQIHWENVRLK